MRELKFLAPVFILLFAFFFVACSKKEKKTATASKQGGNKPPPLRVDVFVVKTRALSENLELPGTLIANEATEIHPEISGRIVMLNVSEGRQVGKGAVLVKLYDGDLQAQLRKLQTQLAIAQQSERRSAELLKIQGISQQDYDLSLLNVNNIRADMDVVRANITKTVIRAPFSGKLGLKNISPGAFVTPQTIIATIRQTSQLKLDFTLPEKYTGRIKTGHEVSFRVEGNQKTYSAKVMALESGITENTRTLNVRATVVNKDDDLVPGSFAKVLTNFPADSNAIMVPTQAILPQARGKKVILYKGGTAVFADVVTGIRDTSQVQIVDGKIKAGDTIVITGLLSIRPEGKIQVNKVVNP